MTRTSAMCGDRWLAYPLACLAAALAFVCALAGGALAQQPFPTPEAAVQALVTAAKAADVRAVMQVLGPGSQDIVSSGDPVDDANTRKRFIEAYEAKNRIVKEGDDKAILELGEDDWPFPIPLLRKNAAWTFDVAAGREEILMRRIGRNELHVIQASLAYVDAQHEYAEKGYGGAGLAAYAQRIVSRPGKKDGLYWPPAPGDPESPLGEFAAKAAFDGYRPGQQSIPFHGYYYKVLTRQGPAAPGGAIDYVVKGNMIGGFALIAYPAMYENSGIMTFIVNQDGVIYEKDLGPKTAQIAGAITAFNPDQGWEKVVNDGVPQTSAKP